MYFQTREMIFLVLFAMNAVIGTSQKSRLEDRAVCSGDNVLRALRAAPNRASASDFCNSLILQGVPTTTLITAGVTPVPV